MTLFAWATLGCSDPIDVDYTGVHVLVAADDDLILCGGTLTHMDEFVARLSAEFGIGAPTGSERLVFQWVSPEEYPAVASCPEVSTGCFQYESGRIVAKEAPLNHEIVHSLASSYGRSLPFFEEGLAGVFQGIETVHNLSPVSYDVWSTIDADDGILVDRTAAAGFVAALIARYGLEVFLDLYSEIPPHTAVEEIDQVFQSMLGTSLTDSVADFAAANPPFVDIQDFDAKIMECNAPDLAWDGFELTEFRTLDCTQEDAIGPYDGEVVQVMRTINFDRIGDFEINVIANNVDTLTQRSALSLLPCGVAGAETRVYAGERVRVPLALGRYSLRLLGSATAVTEIGYTITRIDPIGP